MSNKRKAAELDKTTDLVMYQKILDVASQASREAGRLMKKLIGAESKRRFVSFVFVAWFFLCFILLTVLP